MLEPTGEEAKLIDEIQKRTGVLLPRLAMIEKLDGEARRQGFAVAAELVEQCGDATRGVLCRIFVNKGAHAYLGGLYRWHAGETEDYAIQSLEHAIVNNTRSSDAPGTVRHFLSHSGKLYPRALSYLVRRARSNSELLAALRRVYEERRFDLSILCAFARTAPKGFNLIAGVGADPLPAGRLPARQLLSALCGGYDRMTQFRLPVPLFFYGTVRCWIPTTLENIPAEMQRLLSMYEVDPRSAVLDSPAKHLKKAGDCVPIVTLRNAEFSGQLVVLLTRLNGSDYRLGLLQDVGN